MDFLEELFDTNKLIPLKKKGNLVYELEYQRQLIIECGFEIINTYENGDDILVL